MAELILWGFALFGIGYAAGRVFAGIQQRRINRKRAARHAAHARAGMIGIVHLSAPRAPQAVRREAARG